MGFKQSDNRLPQLFINIFEKVKFEIVGNEYILSYTSFCVTIYLKKEAVNGKCYLFQ